MRPTTTLVLLAVTGCVLFFVFQYEQNLPDTNENRAAKEKPMRFDPAKADSIEITGKDLSVRLRKENNRWQVLAPFADRANQPLVHTLLDKLSATSWLQTINRDDLKNGDWKRAALSDATTAGVTVRSQKATIAQCKYGGDSAIENAVYASSVWRDGSEIIHLASGDVAALLRRPADDWRDPKLLDIVPESIKRLSISSVTGALEFARDANHPWMLMKPLQTRAASDRVTAVLAAFLNLDVKPRAASHAPVLSASSTAPVQKISIERAGFDKPVDIVLQPGTANEPEPVVSVSDRAGLFTVPQKIADIWKLQPNVLRDQHIARLPKDGVDSFRIRSAAFPEIVLTKKGDTWMLARRGSEEQANGDRVQKLIAGLNAATVQEFASDAPPSLAPYGLTQPFLEVQWAIGGKTTILHFGKGEPEGVFAKQADEPFVYRIAGDLFVVIPPDSVKWRGLAALDLSIFSVHRIVISEGAKPPVILDYDPNQASWHAEIAGKDVTPLLVRQLADSLLNKVCKLPAVDWTSDHTEAYAALQKPTLSVQLHVADPRDPDSKPKPMTITFAPTAEGKDTAFYHGRINSDPDTFLISREVYRQLVTAVVK